MGFHTKRLHQIHNWRQANPECCFNPWFLSSCSRFALRLGSLEILSVSSRLFVKAFCLCGLIACLGTDWHGIVMPTCDSSSSWLLPVTGARRPLRPPHRLFLWLLMEINECGEVNKGSFRRRSLTSSISSETPFLMGES